MIRPEPIEMLASLFPELLKAKSKSEREASVKYSLLASEVVCLDLIRLFDQGLLRHGPGVLVMRLNKGARESTFLTADDISQDYEIAKADGDKKTAEALKSVIALIESTNPEKWAVLMRVDNSGMSAMRINREHPTEDLESKLEQITE
jgi:hypothetical protein